MPTVLRIITRLNIGGPSIQATRLVTELEPFGYTTVLLHGRLGPGEGDMSYLLAPGADARYVSSLRRSLAPTDDARSLSRIWKIVRELKPDIVHTHMAKAGLLGRVAAHGYNRTVRRGRRIRIVHTYHGHVLEGYFSRSVTAAFIAAERRLARWTDRLISVSPLVRDDLVDRFHIGTREQFRVVPLGFDLAPLAAVDSASRAAARATLGLPRDRPIVGTVGRLTAIKNHELFLDAASLILERVPAGLFLIVGDGERRNELEQLVAKRGLASHVRFLGWQRDLATVYGAMDVFLLTSRNEGTPVALIEAMAAGVAGVATSVGGVPDVLNDPAVGVLVPPDDPNRLADAAVTLVGSDTSRAEMGRRARESALARYSIGRLAADIARLYDSLLAAGRAAR